MSAEDLIAISGSVYLYFSLCRGRRPGSSEVIEYAGGTLAVSTETPEFEGDQSDPWEQHMKEKRTQKC